MEGEPVAPINNSMYTFVNEHNGVHLSPGFVAFYIGFIG